MTRPSEITRERILKAAERLFADRGYEETSIRALSPRHASTKPLSTTTSVARTASTAKSCGRLFAP